LPGLGGRRKKYSFDAAQRQSAGGATVLAVQCHVDAMPDDRKGWLTLMHARPAHPLTVFFESQVGMADPDPDRVPRRWRDLELHRALLLCRMTTVGRACLCYTVPATNRLGSHDYPLQLKEIPSWAIHAELVVLERKATDRNRALPQRPHTSSSQLASSS